MAQKLQAVSPDAPNFIMGDFNHVCLKKVLKNYYQYVTCFTRRDKILDRCYGSVRDAYNSVPLPPLGSADHNCVYLLPSYKTVLKRENTRTRDVKVWSEDSILSFQECFSCTDWNIFVHSCGDDLDELVDVTCSYMAFCRDMIIPCKRVKIYPNNKPWVSVSVKACIQRKAMAFKNGSASDLHSATKELKMEIIKSKHKYKLDLESKMAANNLGSAWASMKILTGLQSTEHGSLVI